MAEAIGTVFSGALTTAGYTTVYTVPAGKSAVLTIYSASVAYRGQVRINGIDAGIIANLANDGYIGNPARFTLGAGDTVALYGMVTPYYSYIVTAIVRDN